MTRTFCDICGEELESRTGKSEIATEQGSNPSTSLFGDCESKGNRLLFAFKLMKSTDSTFVNDICRQCVLEAVRYIADNK